MAPRAKDASHQPASRYGVSLRAKLLLPFLGTLLLVGVVAGSGSIHLFKTSLISSADDRLLAAREVLYREFKKQETILATYTSFLQQFQSLVDRFPAETELGILQNQLLATLEASEITAAFYPLSAADRVPLQSLQDLFEQARRSGKPRFRYSNEFNSQPSLLIAAPLLENSETTAILVLQTTMGSTFLQQTTAPLRVRSSLHNLNGAILAKSDPAVTPIVLTDAQLMEVSSGKKLFFDDPGSPNQRHLLTAIPLGTSDLILLSLEAEPEEGGLLMDKLTLQATLGIMITLLLGALLYFKSISSVLRPIGHIQDAVSAIDHGNLSHRISHFPGGELGELSRSINQMAENLNTRSTNSDLLETGQKLIDQQARHKLLLEIKDKELAGLAHQLSVNQRETGALLQLNQAMIAVSDPDSLFDRILQVLDEALACRHIVLLVYNPGESVLEVAGATGIEDGLLDSVRFSFDEGICGKVAEGRQLIYVKDVEQDDRALGYQGLLATRGSLVSAPLVVKNNLIGVLNLHKNQVEGFTTSELKLIQATANQAAIVIHNAQLSDQSRDISNTDPLTGLANRRYFQDVLKREVAQARRFNTFFATVMCDLDHFRDFNDVHGRLRGDALLRQVGQVLLRNTRGIDLVCRFGNKQFVLLLPKTDKAGAVITAEKLRQSILNENFPGEEQSQPGGKLTLSFGVTQFPADSENIYELLTLADRCLYFAKQQGRNRTVAWDKTLEEIET